MHGQRDKPPHTNHKPRERHRKREREREREREGGGAGEGEGEGEGYGTASQGRGRFGRREGKVPLARRKSANCALRCEVT